MSLDQRLRAGLHRSAAAIVPDRSAALRAVQRRARRQARASLAFRIVAVAAAVVVAVGLGSVAAQRLGNEPPAEPITSSGVAGAYAVTVPASPYAEGTGLVGRWEVLLREDGTVRLTPPSTDFGFTRDGTYRLEGDILRADVLLDVPGCQTGSSQVGTYRWSRIGDELVFREIDDGCVARRQLFTAQPWKELS